MSEPVFIIDGSKFDDFAGFIQEFNRAFSSQLGAEWHGNLDAFNDFLSWPGGKYTLLWKQSDLSGRRLDYDKMAKCLEECVRHCHPTNVPHMRERLEKAERGEGQTLFDVLLEIIRDNKEYVDLRLE
jgi:hypothetical protein